MRRFFTVIAAAFLLSVACFASVGVNIPSFSVSFNGQQVSSNTREYPLIVYNDITYFPMTYHDCSYLGLVSTWDAATSTFSVNKGESSGKYHSYETSYENSKYDIADVCSFNIVVNGKNVDNKTEQYPLLVYRDVTYFPLTWRFAVDEFGWNYSFSSQNGLFIASDGSTVPEAPAQEAAKPEMTIPVSDADSYVDTVENSPSATNNYWGVWSEALNLKSSGNYKAAIDKILSISSVFIRDNMSAPASNAMLFKHLGECHSELSDYIKASVCFTREAYYWSKTSDMLQAQIDAERRSSLIKPYTELYALSTENSGKYYGVEHEPVGGIYLGAIYENLSKPVAGVLEYLNYGQKNTYSVDDDQILQLSLQPKGGIGQVNDKDGYLIDLAKDLENLDCKVILRFAGEMNDSSTLWPSTPDEYIEKFRIVADVFHEYAPSVPVVWAPNFYPTHNIESYYPGDDYVDYVGLSLYQEYQPETDPLGRGVDRSRWLNFLDFVYDTYSDRKPIIIVEGGVAYANSRTDKNLTDYAVSHIKEFFTYLPIKYPAVKMFFVFNRDDQHGRKFSFDNNKPTLDAYNSVIQNKFYYSSTNYTPNKCHYYSLENMSKVKAAVTEICSYSYTPDNNVSYVKYYVNGKDSGTSYGMPFGVNIDFSEYAGKTVVLTAKAFDAKYQVVSEASTYVTVG